MAVINQINLVNNVGESETYDIETKITPAIREYIQNQNKVSTPEDITTEGKSATEANPFIMPYDGFVQFTTKGVGVNGTGEIIMNRGGVLTRSYIFNIVSYEGNISEMYFNKGDSFYLVMNIAAYMTKIEALYFKNRDYTE